jgi:soluble lytic murein transglycosylase-like protein
MVSAPAGQLQAENGPANDVVRIIGVGAEPLKKRQRDERRRMEQRQTTAMSTQAYDGEIRLAASRHRIDPLLLHAIIDTESAYRPAITSPAGAVGLMQIMPATGAELGVDHAGLVDPVRNIDAGARHLKKLQRRYGRNFELILSAYNAGEGAVARYGNRIPPYRETQEYVGKVLGSYDQLRAGIGRTR